MSGRYRAKRYVLRRAITALVAAALVISVAGCADIERGVGTTLNELAASRAATKLASDLEGLDGVGFVASDYDAVASRLHVQLVLTGEPAAERQNWTEALDTVLAAQVDADLRGSAVAATVLTDGGAGLALSSGTLDDDRTATAVREWLDLIASAPLDLSVLHGNEVGLSVDVSNANFSGSEESRRLDRVAERAGLERHARITTAAELGALLPALRMLRSDSIVDSWNLPGFTVPSGREGGIELLDAAQSILIALDPATPLAVTSTRAPAEGVDMTASSLGLKVTLYSPEPIDSAALTSMRSWPALRSIISALDAHAGGSVSLMAPGGGASLFVGTCDGVLTEGSSDERSLVEALQVDLALGPDALSPGYCAPEP